METLLRVAREISLGPVEAVPPGEGKAFCVEGETIAVFRARDGSLHAVQNSCPHQGGPLSEGVAGGCTVICPYHSWKFDLASGACLNDAAHRLRTYPVRAEGGMLLVSL